MNRKLKEKREAEMATGNGEMLAELRCTVHNGRADNYFKIIMFTFGTVFFFLCVQ